MDITLDKMDRDDLYVLYNTVSQYYTDGGNIETERRVITSWRNLWERHYNKYDPEPKFTYVFKGDESDVLVRSLKFYLNKYPKGDFEKRNMAEEILKGVGRL